MAGSLILMMFRVASKNLLIWRIKNQYVWVGCVEVVRVALGVMDWLTRWCGSSHLSVEVSRLELINVLFIRVNIWDKLQLWVHVLKLLLSSHELKLRLLWGDTLSDTLLEYSILLQLLLSWSRKNAALMIVSIIEIISL